MEGIPNESAIERRIKEHFIPKGVVRKFIMPNGTYYELTEAGKRIVNEFIKIVRKMAELLADFVK